MILQPRDREIIGFVEKMKAATSKQLCQLFFPGISINFALRRLQKINQGGYLKREYRKGEPSIFYTGKKIPWQHTILVTEFYCHAVKHGTIEILDKELIISNIRPDAYIEVSCGNITYCFFLEVQISNVKADLEKYKSILYTWKDDTLPAIVLITDQKNIKPINEFECFIIPTTFKGIEKIWEV